MFSREYSVFVFCDMQTRMAWLVRTTRNSADDLFAISSVLLQTLNEQLL